MLPLLPTVHHLKLSPQGTFGEELSQTAVLFILRVCDFFDVVKNRGCKQNSYDEKLVINSKKSQTLSGVAASQSEAAPQSKDLLYPAEHHRSHRNYFTSTVAPASANFFLMVSASSLLTPSLMVLGAPSTRSLASFKPRLVTSRTALITLILFAPTAVRTTANSVFSSAGAAAPAAAPPPATITGAAAAAETPRRDSSFLTNSAASSKDRPTIDSSNCCRSAIVFSSFVRKTRQAPSLR